MKRCNVLDGITNKPCTGPRPCPLHNQEAWWDAHGDREGPEPEINALGGVGGDNDTYEICTGPLTFNVMELRKRGAAPTVIAALYHDIVAVYRRWEMRDLEGPKWGAYHHVDHWLINGSDRDQGRRGFFTDDVRLAQHFDSPEEAVVWIRECDFMHPEHPNNHERAGFTILRIR